MSMWEAIKSLDAYHFFALFAIYSMAGWLIESIYMSICNRKVTNRGFARGPFCPIYGVGCFGAFILFAPFKGNYIAVYLLGCVTATLFEFVVGSAMLKYLGECWWDYKEKPLNYKGIICLESTLAWGIYALIVVHILHGAVLNLVDHIDKRLGILLLSVIYFLVFIDYMVQISQIFGWPKVLGGKGLKDKPDISRATRVNHPEGAWSPKKKEESQPEKESDPKEDNDPKEERDSKGDADPEEK